jgi:hypothetical protein
MYFIRHNFNGIDESVLALTENSLIGFHFANEFYETKEEYQNIHSGYEKGFSRAFDAFASLGETGGLVVFEYNNPDHFFVARVNGNQKIQRLDFTTSDRDKLIYKVLHYNDLRQFNYANFLVLLALRPPYSTICQPGEHYQRIVRHIYLGEPLPMTVNLLHPKVLEQLCENYLRSEFVEPSIRIQYTIMKTGKTLPILDIVGRSMTGQKLLVQVTHHSDEPALEKANRLVNIQGTIPGTTSILFSADEALSLDGLHRHFNISRVFDKFKDSEEPWHQDMIKEMLGIKIATVAVGRQ